MSNASIDLQGICAELIDVAKEAGNIILEARPTSHSTSTKKNTADIVIETDQAVETFIRNRLGKLHPTFAFIGEETHHDGTAMIISDEPTFIVDPIDGTSNFVHGFLAVCVFIGLVVQKQPAVGVVYNPFLRELWFAVKGHGAFTQYNDGERQRLPLTKSSLRGLGPACIGIGWGSDREGPNFELNLKVFTQVARTAASGGQTAAGQQDAFWGCGCWAWDVAAAWCILSEAGGLMVDGHPGEWEPPVNNRIYLAVRPATEGQHEFVDAFWSVIGDGRSTYGP
ncbi:related to quinic acid utilisation protein QUTG (inositol-1(or 4)-monophosphatase) [Rhynchosporium agropyri]|uniref:Inositol-1-monophosphatase n=1 Tax=Rhynchosporium agropyri TaxID=914238 RepID=A0A1E1LKK1_9HELO|nr:related to quinic acid utilisation protein QUTG (inositol-1(or 4)-monophosphatase) [Rhynchosporium agropyri]